MGGTVHQAAAMMRWQSGCGPPAGDLLLHWAGGARSSLGNTLPPLSLIQPSQTCQPRRPMSTYCEVFLLPATAESNVSPG